MSALNTLAPAFVVGAAFGWSLERAGLGDARKLAGQFYLQDFTVLKVMMSAILTTMLGAFWLGRLSLIDLTSFYIPETFLLAQAVGGLIFGIGFVVSGLCPGTSCVAAATGKADGFSTALGLLLGVLLTGLAMPLLQPLYEATPRGTFTLPELLRLPYGVVVAIITLAALGIFYSIERRERRA